MPCPDCFVPSITHYIGYYEDCISEDDCDKIMSHNWPMQKSTYANNKGKVKASDERVKMDEVWVKQNMPFYENLKTTFIKVISKYSTDHRDFACIHHTDFRINKYSEGGFMSRHCDNIHHSHGQHYGYPQVSSLLFLNDDYEGGEFIVAGEIFFPKKGSAIIFPSNFMYPHKVGIVTKGTRWSIVSWLR